MDAWDSVSGETEHGSGVRILQERCGSVDFHDIFNALSKSVVPDIVAAFREGDWAWLKKVSEDAAEREFFRASKERDTKGEVWDSRILGHQPVEISDVRLIKNDPVLVLSTVFEHVTARRDAKTGELVSGSDSTIVPFYYVMAIRHELGDPLGFNWKVVEFQSQEMAALA
jgi:predicted lipid-binding transport protein (Tim44 family)